MVATDVFSSSVVRFTKLKSELSPCSYWAYRNECNFEAGESSLNCFELVIASFESDLANL